MGELSIQEGGNKWFRYLLTFALVAILLLTITMNALAGVGKDPFTSNTGDISHRHHTDITPAPFTFTIWSIIYIWLVINVIYSVVILFVKIGYEPAWQHGGAVSNSFLAVFCINLCLNVSWLFAWDAEEMIAAAVLLLLIAITNTTSLTFALKSFQKTASSLFETSKVHFWCSVLFLNGQGVYDMWTTIAAILNLVIMIDDVSDLNMNSVCIGALTCLLIMFIIYFIVEQVWLVELVNPVLTHYIVYLWATIGVYAENKNTASDAVLGLIIANLVAACLMLVLRIIFMAIRNKSCQIYRKLD